MEKVQELLKDMHAWVIEEERKRRKGDNRLTLVSFNYCARKATEKSGAEEDLIRATLGELRKITIALKTTTHDVFPIAQAEALLVHAQTVL